MDEKYGISRYLRLSFSVKDEVLTEATACLECHLKVAVGDRRTICAQSLTGRRLDPDLSDEMDGF